MYINLFLNLFSNSDNQVYEFYQNIYQLSNISLQIPKLALRNDTESAKYAISAFRQDIMKAINLNRVVCIVSEAGIGKTTQIGQYILDYYQIIGQNCRIVFSEPSDLVAYAAAKRVARERCECLGQTVGCHLAQNLKITSLFTLLTFCSNRVLLKNLMGSSVSESTLLNSTTHIILDEIEIRDRYSDFIFILLKDLLLKYKHLKLVLISGNVNVEIIQKYFSQCPSIMSKMFKIFF